MNRVPSPFAPLSLGARMGMPALGGLVCDARLERIQSSPHFDGKRFVNPIATPQMAGNMADAMKDWVHETQTPDEPLPQVRPARGSLDPGQGEALRVTWLGHSSVLLEIDGHLILTDPVFGPRPSPMAFMGPKRFAEPPVTIEELPPLDAVLISHDHYDHLDHPTILKLAKRPVRFITALGVGAHLEAWGIAPERITELDWWETAQVGGVEFTATPARHFQGRGPSASARTFWGSWAMRGPRSSVWFSGDTGRYDAGFTEIGERFGGFDLTLIEVGAFHPAWGNIHLGPDNAMRVHEQVRGKTLLPVHWGTFVLAPHAWDQPIRRVMELAEATGTQILAPIMGETVHREAGVHAYWQAVARAYATT